MHNIQRNIKRQLVLRNSLMVNVLLNRTRDLRDFKRPWYFNGREPEWFIKIASLSSWRCPTSSELLPYSMEQSLSLEANTLSASQENPPFLEPQTQYRILNFAPPVPFLSQIDTVHAPQSTSCKSILIISFTQAWFSKCYISLSFPPSTTLYTRFLFPMHAIWPVQIIVLLWSTEQYLVMNIDHKAPHYTDCSTPLLPRPSWTQMSSSAPYSRTSSVYIPPSMKNDEISHPFKQ